MQSVLSKFQVISDVHLECIKAGVPDIQADAPYLVIAGDLGYPNQASYWNFLTDASTKYQLVFLVLGNHEYHCAEFGFVPRFVREQIAKQGLLNVILLDNATFDLWVDGLPVRVIGSTLWSRAPADGGDEYAKIRVKTQTRYISFDHICNTVHEQSALWLDAEIDRCAEDGRYAIVVTHYLPSFRLIHPDYASYPKNEYYASHLDYLLRPPVVVGWFFGHTHARGKVVVNDVPCLVGAIGYPGEAVKEY